MVRLLLSRVFLVEINIIIENVVLRKQHLDVKALSKPMIRKWWVIVNTKFTTTHFTWSKTDFFNEHNFIKSISQPHRVYRLQ
jgi:hypothetical protein